ncbi:MAG: T9SS type A sorting domain-containing protein [Flavobacteriales bacterium]|nr:T9SS type A sorting domain-containing protein [Flavobacteriales bacterium]
MKLIFILISFLPLLVTGQQIQNELISNGGGSSTNGAQIDWSVGEPVTETQTFGTNSITQGFHQSHFVVTLVEEHESTPTIGVRLYPNPTTQYTYLEFDFTLHPYTPIPEIKYEIRNLEGKVLSEERINGVNKVELDLSQFATAIYFIHLYQGDALFNVYKVQKVN